MNLGTMKSTFDGMKLSADSDTSMGEVATAQVAEIVTLTQSRNYKNVQQVLGNLSAFQSLWRQLRTGESRSVVCRATLAKRKDMYLCANLKKRLATEANMELDESDLLDGGTLPGGVAQIFD